MCSVFLGTISRRWIRFVVTLKVRLLLPFSALLHVIRFLSVSTSVHRSLAASRALHASSTVSNTGPNPRKKKENTRTQRRSLLSHKHSARMPLQPKRPIHNRQMQENRTRTNRNHKRPFRRMLPSRSITRALQALVAKERVSHRETIHSKAPFDGSQSAVRHASFEECMSANRLKLIF